MQYRGSYYNYKVIADDGSMLVMNMRTEAKIKIPKKYVSKISCVIDPNVKTQIDEKRVSKLLEEGFVVPDTLDESKLIEMKINELVFGGETLDVTILPTLDCNFRCSYCFETTNDYRMTLETEERVIKFFEREIPHCKQLRLSWFGGEPLVCTEQVLRMTRRINDICKKNKVPMRGFISTNGYCLEVPVFRELVKNRITKFQICLDGPERFHNVSRPHSFNDDSYRKILENLINIKNNVGSGVYKIAIRCNVTPTVEPYMEEYIDELSRYFKGDNRFSLIFQCVRNWGGEKVKEEQIVKSEQEVYMKLFLMAREKGVNSSEAISFAPVVGVCQAAQRNGFMIDPKGNLRKCSLAMFNKDTKNVDQIGTIDSNGKKHINEEKLAKWIMGMSEHKEKCKKCFLFPYCMGGHCPYSKNILNKDDCNLYNESILKEHLLAYDKSYSIKVWDEI